MSPSPSPSLDPLVRETDFQSELNVPQESSLRVAEHPESDRSLRDPEAPLIMMNLHGAKFVTKARARLRGLCRSLPDALVLELR